MEPGRTLRLQSNLSLDDYPLNSGWDFSNKVDRYYLFHGPSHGHHREVEIALAEVFLPSRYRNVTATHGWWELHVQGRHKKWGVLLRQSVEPGFYVEPHKLALPINEAIIKTLKQTKHAGAATIEIETAGAHFAFTTGTVGIKLGLDLARLWGFDAGRLMSAPPIHKFTKGTRYFWQAPHTGNVHANKAALAIHCSSIEETMTGPQYTQLMQLAHWKPAASPASTTSRHIEFPHPAYHRIVDRGLDHLTIQIYDSAGVPVEFYGENTTVCLWVRERAHK